MFLSQNKSRFTSPTLLALQILLTLLAALITVRVIYIQQGAINPDAVLYYEAARLFSLGLWHQGFEVFNWPFYSLCIAFINKLTGLSIENSASLLSIVFFSLTTFSFLKLIELAGGRRREILAGALILLSSKHIVGITLSMHIRDQGFWAFFLIGLLFFIRFHKNRNQFEATCWQISILIATLFRLEGVAYLLLLPISLFLFNDHPLKKNFYDLLKSNYLNIGLLIIIFITALSSNSISIQDFGRLHEVFGITAYQEFSAKLVSKSKIFASQVLGRYLDDYATQGMLLTILYAATSEIVRATGKWIILLFGLALVTTFNRLDENARKIFLFSSLIALISFYLITTKTFVIADRYAFPFTFCSMILASFYLSHIGSHIFSKGKLLYQLAFLVLVTLMVAQLIKNVLPKEKEYCYQLYATAWIKKHNIENVPIFYDESILRYYAKESFIGKYSQKDRMILNLDQHNLLKYKYLLISHYEYDPAYIVEVKNLPSMSQFSEIKSFSTKSSKRKVLIYERRNN